MEEPENIKEEYDPRATNREREWAEQIRPAEPENTGSVTYVATHPTSQEIDYPFE